MGLGKTRAGEVEWVGLGGGVGGGGSSWGRDKSRKRGVVKWLNLLSTVWSVVMKFLNMRYETVGGGGWGVRGHMRRGGDFETNTMYAAGGAMLIVNRQLIVVIIKTLYLNCAEIRQNIKKSRKKLLSNSQDKLKKKLAIMPDFKKLVEMKRTIFTFLLQPIMRLLSL